MTIININDLQLEQGNSSEDPRQCTSSTFPLFGAHGTTDSATVYFELEPGDHIGRHTDSAEEILLVLQGELEAEVDGERQKLSKGDLVLVPKLVPHNIINVGKERARVLGFFGGAAYVRSTFEKRWEGMEGNVVDTAAL
jgi:quercetin dioxygenase-like cupin family protein